MRLWQELSVNDDDHPNPAGLFRARRARWSLAFYLSAVISIAAAFYVLGVVVDHPKGGGQLMIEAPFVSFPFATAAGLFIFVFLLWFSRRNLLFADREHRLMLAADMHLKLGSDTATAVTNNFSQLGDDRVPFPHPVAKRGDGS